MLLPLLMNLRMFTPAAPSPARVLGGLSRVVQQTKAVGTTSQVLFDFISRLAPEERIASATVTISIYRGNLNGLSLIGAATVDGTKIYQMLSGGDPSTIYLLECIATTEAGLKPYLTSFFTVR